jgi:large subunit ribosomal protein L25
VAESFSLEAQARTIIGKKVSQLRRQGLVPVSVYGPKSAPVSLQIPYRALELTLRNAGGTNLIDIKHDGSTTTVLARDVQRDILRNDIIHVDFFAVDLKAKIEIDVPVHFINEAPAVQQKLGILITGPTSLTVETLPTNMPQELVVNLSSLAAVGDTIHVRDLNYGEGIVILNDADELIAGVRQSSAARSEEQEALEEAEGAVAEVEIIKKGKGDEEEAE